MKKILFPIFAVCSCYILAANDASADVISLSQSFEDSHPRESVLHGFIYLMVVISFIIAFSLIVLGKVRRDRNPERKPIIEDENKMKEKI